MIGLFRRRIARFFFAGLTCFLDGTCLNTKTNLAVNEITIQVLERYLTMEVTEEEQQLVETWLSENNMNEAQLRELMLLPEGVKVMLRQDVNASWHELQARMSHQPSRSLVFTPLRIAASLLPLIAVAVTVYFIGRQQSLRTNGLHVVENTTATPRKVMLPDSSEVVLNRGSRISYQDNFPMDRSVSLGGEAFFEVRRDEAHPFRVNVGRSRVTVLGTSFSVIDNESALDVVVATGKVSVQTPGNSLATLTPGQRSHFLKSTGELQTSTNTDENYTSWMTGVLKFRQATISEVATALGRHFSVHITVVGRADGIRYTSQFKDPTLDEVLKEMKEVVGTTSRKEGSDVIIRIP